MNFRKTLVIIIKKITKNLKSLYSYAFLLVPSSERSENFVGLLNVSSSER